MPKGPKPEDTPEEIAEDAARKARREARDVAKKAWNDEHKSGRLTKEQRQERKDYLDGLFPED